MKEAMHFNYTRIDARVLHGQKVLRGWYYDLDRPRGDALALFAFEAERFGFSINTCDTAATLSATSRVTAAARPTLVITFVARCLSFAIPLAAWGFLAFLVFREPCFGEGGVRRAAIGISLSIG